MRTPALIIGSIVTIAAGFIGGPAHAQDELRCGGKIIDLGVDIAYVLDLCGAPKERVVTEEPIRARNSSGASWVIGTTRVERLTYDRGSGRFPAVLDFEDGKLLRIEYLLSR
jgi:hypothetical protein